MAAHSKTNGSQLKALLREARSVQRDLDRAVALADQEIGSQSSVPPLPFPAAPIQPVPAPAPVGGADTATSAGALPAWARDGRGDATFGVPGTPITSGFLVDLGEYNPELVGRNAIPTYEKMRRGDAQVRATLAAVKLPVQSATWEIVPADPTTTRRRGGARTAPTSSHGAGRTTQAKANEVCEFVKENLFGGLEFRNSTGGWTTQSWDEVVRNALLMVEFGCAGHEDVWRIDGDRIRLRRLAARLPLTFFRWHVDADGETLLALEQWGYRGWQFLNALLPADKVAVFTYQQEGANFWGIPLSRAMYPHWYIKSNLYRIDAIACERNALGTPVFKLSPGFSKEDHDAAYNFVTQLAAHESTGLVEPPGDQYSGLRIVATQGSVREIMPSIQHHNQQISIAALAMFMNLGTTETGSRALGKEHTDFFLLALQNLADQIAYRLTTTSVRRLVYYNFGEDAPCPRLVAANVRARSLEDIVDALTRFAEAGLVVSDDDLRGFIRDQLALPGERKSEDRTQESE